MNARVESFPHSEYVNALRCQLPSRAFAAAPQKLWMVWGHLMIVLASYLGIRYSPFIACDALLSLIIAHSFTCLAFFGTRVIPQCYNSQQVHPLSARSLVMGSECNSCNYVAATTQSFPSHSREYHPRSRPLFCKI